MSTKEEQSLEKDLILEQVSRLIERLSTRADAGKDDTLSLAKKVNDLQNKIKDITRKMMATLSELAIHQADALKLQQEKNMKDVELRQYYARMEQVIDFVNCHLGFIKKNFCLIIREIHRVKILKVNGNVPMNLKKDVKLNEELEKTYVFFTKIFRLTYDYFLLERA